MPARVPAPAAAVATAVDHLETALRILREAAGDPRDVPLCADAEPLGIMDCVELEKLIAQAITAIHPRSTAAWRVAR